MKTPLIINLSALAIAIPSVLAEVTVREDGDQWAIRIDGELFTKYRLDRNNPCFYPVIGPAGVRMTRQFPLEDAAPGEKSDHPHHTSLWFTHGDVNKLDFWHGGGKHKEKGGKVVQDKLINRTDGANEASMITSNKWVSLVGEKEICRDVRRMAFGKTTDGSKYVDFKITITATNGDVVFGDTKEGSMSIRTHPNLRLQGEVANGQALNSAGDENKDLWGKAAKWVNYWGEVDGKSVGVSIFDHPKNPRHPTTWHARDYGLIAVNPFGYSYFYKGQNKRGDLTIKDGESVTFRYRFLFHGNGADKTKVENHYTDFAESLTAALPAPKAKKKQR